MIFITAFIVVAIIGAILDGLFAEKAKTSPATRFFLRLIPSPFNFVRLYSKLEDNLDDFTRTHATTGITFFASTLIVAGYAFYADYSVLWGMEYVATRNESYAFWQAVGISMLIQLALVFNGGMACKLLINDMLHDADHNIQFKFNLGLATIAFVASLYLSFQTFYVAESKGIESEKTGKENLMSDYENQKKVFDGQITTLSNAYFSDSTNIEKHFQETVSAANNKFTSDSIRKASDAKIGINSLAVANGRINAFRLERDKKIEAAALERKAAFKNLESVTGSQIDKLQSNKTNALSKLQTKIDEFETELGTTVAFNANVTRYKNIFLNFIALLLNIGFQFYMRGVSNHEKRRRLETAAFDQQNGIQNNDKPTDSWDTIFYDIFAGAGNFLRRNIRRAVPKSDVTKQIENGVPVVNSNGGSVSVFKNGGNGGTGVRRGGNPNVGVQIPTIPLQENQPIENEELELEVPTNEETDVLSANIEHLVKQQGHEILLAYKKASGEITYWNYSRWRQELKNQINKYNKSKKDSARLNKLNWIRMIESKLAFIERESDPNFKAYPKRLSFDTQDPMKELFPY